MKIVNGYIEGAKSVNPDIDVKTAWTNSYVDTQLAQESASRHDRGRHRRHQALRQRLRQRLPSAPL